MRALRLMASITFVWLAVLTGSAWPQERYLLDPQSGRIEFSVSHFGLFTSHGEFRRFSGELWIDSSRPERTQITFEIDPRSIEIPWRDWVRRLLSPAYFDVDHFPVLWFRSTAITADSEQAYSIHGVIEIRGIARPLTLSAKLVSHKQDTLDGLVTVDLVATGHLKRSEFGMIADPLAVSNDINLTVDARLEVPRPLVIAR